MGSQRPLLCPWLIEQINSQQYPGLHWINAEKTQFRMPWKHGLRQDISADDTKIFEAWAITSGRYRPCIDSPDPSVWKRNFRSALHRKKHFRRVVDNRNNSEDPHVIYEIQSIDEGASVSAEEESEDVSPATDNSYSGLSSISPNPRTLESSLKDMTILEQLTVDSGEMTQLERDMAFSALNYSPDHAVLPSHLSQTSPITEPLLGASGGAAWEMPAPVEDPSSMTLNIGEFQAQMRGYFPNGEFVTEFEVAVYYRGRKVQEKTVKNINGFRLFYSSESTFPSLQDLQLPDISMISISDQQQIKYTNQLLERMGQGLIVEVQNNQIRAQRHGSCKAFWSMMQNPGSSEPQQISSKELTVLYDFPQFNREINAFLNSAGGSPQYSMWLCFGELWPDPDGKPWNKKLIMVQVTPVTFKLLHEMAHGVGASSLQSDDVNLQLSDPLSTSSFLSILEEFMDIE
ncbi:interferon regulatory factor 3 isoform X2 [Heterodontus francisci]|uniref:interferon regulatory factor 3 isoform X2 n=1 Tax=Heterodontus francisci TaxID=7792 RepID=UPI00355B03E4